MRSSFRRSSMINLRTSSTLGSLTLSSSTTASCGVLRHSGKCSSSSLATVEEHEGGHEEVDLADRLTDAQQACKPGGAAASEASVGAKLAARKVTLLKLMEGIPDVEQGMDEKAGTGLPDLGQGQPPTGFDGPGHFMMLHRMHQSTPINSPACSAHSLWSDVHDASARGSCVAPRGSCVADPHDAAPVTASMVVVALDDREAALVSAVQATVQATIEGVLNEPAARADVVDGSDSAHEGGSGASCGKIVLKEQAEHEEGAKGDSQVATLEVMLEALEQKEAERRLQHKALSRYVRTMIIELRGRNFPVSIDV